MIQTIKPEAVNGINPANIPPNRLDEYFEKGEWFNGTLAELLLQNERTAVYHIDPERTFFLGDVNEYYKQLFLGANYNGNAHSEGKYRIVVQNVQERKGPYVLFNPPGANERTFYLQSVDRLFEPKFEEMCPVPGKILSWYLCRGNPLQIFEDFRNLGFSFKDEPMTKRDTMN